MFGLTKEELRILRRMNTPAKVQEYLDSIPSNKEKDGETCMSPRRVLQQKKAHCIEGVMLACTAFMLAGRKPLVLNLKVSKDDDDHVIALFKENGYWGAVSKTNHSVLRYRDPVYKTVRELAMSYFHEYFLSDGGKKTMLGYSRPINIKRFGTSWITEGRDLWDIAEYIYDSYHYPAVPMKNKKLLRRASSLEQKASSLPQYQ
jgi:hypothetical protein